MISSTPTVAGVLAADLQITDGDGMPDGWETANGFRSTNADDAALDFDNDGLSNLAEYRAGTNPNDPASYLRIEFIGVSQGHGVHVNRSIS